jgi:hypothetical protein
VIDLSSVHAQCLWVNVGDVIDQHETSSLMDDLRARSANTVYALVMIDDKPIALVSAATQKMRDELKFSERLHR